MIKFIKAAGSRGQTELFRRFFYALFSSGGYSSLVEDLVPPEGYD
jgi:hypothetical protein